MTHTPAQPTTTDTSIDPFSGTIYRALTDAEDAIGLARFHGVDDGLAYDPAHALELLEDACRAIEAARTMLTAGTSR